MWSYIVGLVACLIIFANPITDLLYGKPSGRPASSKLSPRPELNESLLAIDGPDAPALQCPQDTYKARVLRREPLVVYLEDFLSEEERNHLLTISEPLFEPSTITHDASSSSRDTTIRDSSVALIPRTDTVRCVEKRALAFQGWRRDVWVERLRTQLYESPSGHYSHHFDWSRSYAGGWGRVSSFMAWIDDGQGSLEGGGTEFPLLEPRLNDENRDNWCQLIECGESIEEAEGKGTTFKVKPGNAVYWENFMPDGRGYEETWHAGLPVTKGTKVGLNIWSFGRIE